MADHLSQEQWRALSEEMAREYIASELADMMVPANEGLARADKHHAADTQEWRRTVRDMGTALIVLEKLGYRLVKSS